MFNVKVEVIYAAARKGFLPEPSNPQHWIWEDDQEAALIEAWKKRPDRRGRPRLNAVRTKIMLQDQKAEREADAINEKVLDGHLI